MDTSESYEHQISVQILEPIGPPLDRPLKVHRLAGDSLTFQPYWLATILVHRPGQPEQRYHQHPIIEYEGEKIPVAMLALLLRDDIYTGFEPPK
ncbi:hypothetical protein IU453_00265 [Nocardia cyriacigeorgica]|uniref:hypothetical protein n=1 Tax=Nocardia cyriacigeorgica TaxID=135487 RepID=UPI0018946AA2|nr:hypothetical protein [Nocardia cyriacigeorgica]MBF6315225.1 hypothetical protein [Nocardia cyriacigeorgica]MBF6530011.1 hypothetical protein [Nocardia cyriacigeorgica]